MPVLDFLSYLAPARGWGSFNLSERFIRKIKMPVFDLFLCTLHPPGVGVAETWSECINSTIRMMPLLIFCDLKRLLCTLHPSGVEVAADRVRIYCITAVIFFRTCQLFCYIYWSNFFSSQFVVCAYKTLDFWTLDVLFI